MTIHHTATTTTTPPPPHRHHHHHKPSPTTPPSPPTTHSRQSPTQELSSSYWTTTVRLLRSFPEDFLRASLREGDDANPRETKEPTTNEDEGPAADVGAVPESIKE